MPFVSYFHHVSWQGDLPVRIEREGTIFVFGAYELDLGLHELRRGGQLCAIEPQVFDLLAYLIQHRDRLVDKDELNANIWHGRFVSDASLTTAIKHARQSIGDSGKRQALIKTTPRRGFRFIGAVAARGRGAAEKAETIRLAALPFENLSGDPDQSYFADGMTDDLITQLSRVAGLFVISRNSVFTLQGQNRKGRDHHQRGGQPIHRRKTSFNKRKTRTAGSGLVAMNRMVFRPADLHHLSGI